MNEPRNDFENFFDADDHPSMKMVSPPPSVVLEALIRIVGLNPQWYRDKTLRMIVSGGLTHLTEQLSKTIENGEKPPITLGESCLCMVLAERLDSTRRFASEEEEKMFPPSGIQQDNEE